MKTKALLLLLLLQIAAFSLSAAGKPEPLPPGMAKYIMVLWPPGSPIPGGTGTVKDVPEPDVAKMGGKVLAKADNKRVIQLPLAAATALRRHEAVVYLQRVWTGESLTNWNESYVAPAGSRFQLAPHSDTNLQWGPKDYSYDGSGNIKQIDTDQYTYDSAERLIQAAVEGKTETYTYDSFGNLTKKEVAGGNAVNINVDGGSNRLIGVSYDAAGNIGSANDGRRTYKYDSLNMLTRVQRPAADERRMIYDADDERIGTINVGDTLSRWTIRDFEGRVVREFKADNLQMWIWEADNFYGDGALMGGESQEWGYLGSYRYGGRRHYHLDHLGSVRMVTDSSSPARSLSEHDYLPFGATLTRTYQEQINWGDPRIDSMRFAGHWRDFLGVLNVDNTEYLDYMHARYYDPNLGRFLSVDPGPGTPAAPQSWNGYVYSRNNPLNRIDADGQRDARLYGAIYDVEPGDVVVLVSRSDGGPRHVVMVGDLRAGSCCGYPDAYVYELGPITAPGRATLTDPITAKHTPQLIDSNDPSAGSGIWSLKRVAVYGVIPNRTILANGHPWLIPFLPGKVAAAVQDVGPACYANKPSGQAGAVTDCAGWVGQVTERLGGTLSGRHFWTGDFLGLFDWYHKAKKTKPKTAECDHAGSCAQ